MKIYTFFLKIKSRLLRYFLKFSYLFSFRRRLYRKRKQLSRKIFEKFAGEVQSGLFKGLRINQFSWGGADTGTMILGLYEKEILDRLDLIPSTHRTFINLGGADGYYSVGSLVSGKFEECYTFEISLGGRQNIKLLSIDNDVNTRLHISGKAESNFYVDLKKKDVDLSSSVVLCDVEGAEFKIFTEEVFKALRGSYIFIEIHEWRAEKGELEYISMKEQASKYFKIEEIHTSARDLSGYPELHSWSDDDRWLVCSEGRGKLMTWLYLSPLN